MVNKMNKTRTARITIIVGMFLLLHAIAGAGWAGELVGWGLDSSGQVSNAPAGSDFEAVAGGGTHSVALRTDGSLVAWGDDYYGQVSDTPAGNDFTAVAAGGVHNVALKSDGRLVAWGYDGMGQVSNTPAANDFAAVSAGYNHNVALRSDGSLVAWGKDTYRQVRDTPSGSDFTAVAAGYEHNLALKSDGSLIVWGADSYGQVSDTPAGNDLVGIAAGGYHNVALKSDGRLVSWGHDFAGQVSSTPAGNNFVAVAAGEGHSVALKSDGSLVAWGWDRYGEVSQIPSGTDFTAVASRSRHNVAIRDTQTVPIPAVSIVATDASAGEPANDGSFTVSRTGDTSGNLLVYYSTSGSTASSGTDYAALPGYVYILSGQSSAVISVVVIDDSDAEDSETVRVTLSSNSAYTVGSPSNATVTIADDDILVEKPVVAITAPDASAGEPANNGSFTVSRTGGTAGNLLVYYSTSGSTASAGADYAALSGYVYILSGQSSVSILVDVVDDSAVESSETVRLTISSNVAYTIGSPSYATVSITDNDSEEPPGDDPTVTITAPDADAAEPSNHGAFRVSRTGDTSSSLRVYYSTSGSTADLGTDYAAFPSYVDFSSGQSWAVIDVVVIDDSAVENSETVQLTIWPVATYTVGSPSTATVTIADDDTGLPEEKPTVAITAPDASAAEPANDGYFRVSRTGDTSSSLRIYYSTSGTASAGIDYMAFPSYVDIPSGQSSADIDVVVMDDNTVEDSETVRLTISSNTAYTIGSPSSATVTIVDDDTELPEEKPIVAITAPDASAAEPANDGSFTVSRTGATSGSLRVYYSTSGSTASSGADYAALPYYVDIPSGQSSAYIDVVVIDDSDAEDSETVRLTISSNSAYTIGSPSNATVTIADDDVYLPAPPPVEQMMAETLNFFYQSVDNGSLVGVGKGKGKKELNKLQNMLETAYQLIVDGYYGEACVPLSDALSRCDGYNYPPDYVSGDATVELAWMILQVINALDCQ
jgi:hypothetical protein